MPFYRVVGDSYRYVWEITGLSCLGQGKNAPGETGQKWKTLVEELRVDLM